MKVISCFRSFLFKKRSLAFFFTGSVPLDPKKFANSTAGRVMRTRQGYWAFIPAPLPRTLSYSSRLVHLLADAATGLGNLVGAGHVLPDPYLLIYPYMHQEAVLS